MGKFIKILSACAFSLCFIAGISFAQEAADTATEAEMYFASGSVVEATAAQIIISEYDFDAGQETKVSYEINAQTQLEGATGISEIKAGDDVEIEYQTVGDKKIATRVEKYAAEDTGAGAVEEPTGDAGEGAAATEVKNAVETKNEELLNDITEKKLEKEGEKIETEN
ncbi:MAG: hypothetical protein NT079_06805 [Candidatus Omnitrophica bacterium]|nr:hypothetical protein [Candidatus Omnitrophota bacterium]